MWSHLNHNQYRDKIYHEIEEKEKKKAQIIKWVDHIGRSETGSKIKEIMKWQMGRRKKNKYWWIERGWE